MTEFESNDFTIDVNLIKKTFTISTATSQVTFPLSMFFGLYQTMKQFGKTLETQGELTDQFGKQVRMI